MNDVIHSRATARLILFRSLALLYEIVFHRRVEKPAIKIDRNRPISGTFNNNIFPLAHSVGSSLASFSIRGAYLLGPKFLIRVLYSFLAKLISFFSQQNCLESFILLHQIVNNPLTLPLPIYVQTQDSNNFCIIIVYSN